MGQNISLHIKLPWWGKKHPFTSYFRVPRCTKGTKGYPITIWHCEVLIHHQSTDHPLSIVCAFWRWRGAETSLNSGQDFCSLHFPPVFFRLWGFDLVEASTIREFLEVDHQTWKFRLHSSVFLAGWPKKMNRSRWSHPCCHENHFKTSHHGWLQYIWLVVEKPLKNMSSSVGIIIPNIWNILKHVPKHQPVYIYIQYIYIYIP